MNRFIHFAARTVRKSPALTTLSSFVNGQRLNVAFSSSDQYWRERYEKGGNSGEGSYGALSKYKAEFINSFVAEKNISSIIEFGCGDGNQASLFTFAKYTGIDISEKCVESCKALLGKRGYEFIVLEDYLADEVEEAFDLALSLDVVYHLVEDEIYNAYISKLFKSSSRYVLVYASNFNSFDPNLPHVRHREFSRDVELAFPDWTLVETEKNPYEKPHDSKVYGSFAKFHLFEKR
ncbi:class I SAM-dependent methyltransferase [Parasphingorhabdus flavimaris]|uniref:Class I SAM-dependent methyltransferase n=1 Tax=Parasphingorhabdus flavimaris TaxID=266812 RepID=A0ABX2N5M4_9SPHN|nr:class I SAM-dependent methyltransferase [Parasphingorhabdus flavimaris]NVD29028.1 class I SAM-dependent methyltransferase [Parasphingorhabdus flavimaris]